MFCLLLLVCANVASLAIARGVARAREIAIRLALGAGGSRVTRLLIAESVVSALVTTVIAIVLTAWWLDAALSLAPAGIPRVHEVAMNARVALFAAVLALLVTAVGNAIPIFRASRTPIAGALKDGAAASVRASGRLRAGLVVAEIATAVMLLVGAGLLVRTFAELRRVDVGFDTTKLLVLRITPDAARYRTQSADDRLLPPRARFTSRGSRDPVGGRCHGSSDEHDRLRLHAGPIGPSLRRPQARRPRTRAYGWRRRDTSATLGLRVMSGREFTDDDDADAPRVVIINQTLAKSAWGTENPVGRNLVLDYQRGPYPYEVVGVVRDARFDGPRSEPVPEIFIPHSQNPYLVMNVIARTALDPAAVA